MGSLGAVLTLCKANLAILSKELLPGARPCTPCHFMVQFAVRPHPSHQTNPLSWWSPAVLFEDGSSTCQLLALTDAFVRQFAGSIEQSAPRTSQTCSRRNCRNTGEICVEIFGREFKLIFFGQFSGYFSEQFSIQISGAFSVIVSYCFPRFFHACQSRTAGFSICAFAPRYKPRFSIKPIVNIFWIVSSGWLCSKCHSPTWEMTW